MLTFCLTQGYGGRCLMRNKQEKVKRFLNFQTAKRQIFCEVFKHFVTKSTNINMTFHALSKLNSMRFKFFFLILPSSRPQHYQQYHEFELHLLPPMALASLEPTAIRRSRLRSSFLLNPPQLPSLLYFTNLETLSFASRLTICRQRRCPRCA